MTIPALGSFMMATNLRSNGKTDGIALPSSDGQEAVIRKAYSYASLPLDETNYVEVFCPHHSFDSRMVALDSVSTDLIYLSRLTGLGHLLETLLR